MFNYLSRAMEVNGQLIRKVWEKASPILGQDSELFRIDMQGRWIRKKDFNSIDSIYGWTIYPVNSPANDFSDLGKLIPIHTHENQVPLAGIQSPTDMVFKEKYI